jgi:subtilisin family serine protease
MPGTGLAAAAARWAAALMFGVALTAGTLARDAADAEAIPADTLLVMIRMAPAHARPDVDYGDGYAGRAGQAARRRIAEAIARTHRLQLITNWPMPAIGVECYLMRVLPGTEVAAAIEAVSRDPRAEWAQPLQHFAGQSYNDPLYAQQPTAGAWQLHALHAAATGRDVLIAQIDSGADAEHPDLRGKVRETVNAADTSFRAEGHGTAVAGILVAHAGNRIGIAGVAPGASLVAVRACWEREPGAARCDSLALAKGVQIALDRGARVINLSVSGPPDRLLRELLNAAIARGVIVVAAVDAKAADGGFPASSRGVIAVIDLDGALRTAPSRHAPLAAPAMDVPTTSPGARWQVVSGASFATAEVSGMVALLLELLPTARAGRIDALLRGREESQVDVALPAPMPIDACRSVSLAAGRCVCDCAARPAYFTLDRR